MGLIVAPGFVDLHTHYDAQIQWDPYCTISGWHGVTSVVLGNCGFGFAPVREEERDRAMLTMSRTEAIPFESMKEGMLWDWITFPEFLESLDRIPKGVNCLSYVPLAPLMTWVMGLEAAKHRRATDEEIAEMQRLLHEAMDAGACGWSTQRLGVNSVQADYDGTPMVTDIMSDNECLALAEVLAERDEGFIQITQFTWRPRCRPRVPVEACGDGQAADSAQPDRREPQEPGRAPQAHEVARGVQCSGRAGLRPGGDPPCGLHVHARGLESVRLQPGLELRHHRDAGGEAREVRRPRGAREHQGGD